MSNAQEYSITRTRATWKPRVDARDLPFFANGDGNVFLGVSGDQPASYTGSGRTLVGMPPYLGLLEGPAPSGLTRPKLVPCDQLPEEVSIDYRIDGGFNNNCVVASWSVSAESGCEVEWMCLKTFTGMQLKYVMPKKRPPLVFALGDEDAFAYCDKKPCDECAFRCKNGFVLYVGVRNLGIVAAPLDRISSLNLKK
ncbi:hypothetical protein [Gordonibacter sp. An230]|uniref:hypothetical protein n=1 Tax=Gordonibacter sp. An230 TaxID=1965592 RepID=UPI000B39F5D5|nr:hypothetical protein [Gordonibacter sp. An230]